MAHLGRGKGWSGGGRGMGGGRERETVARLRSPTRKERGGLGPPPEQHAAMLRQRSN